LLRKADGSRVHLFTIRYYASPVACKKVLKKKIRLTGTVQKNLKGLPDEVKKKMKMKQQDVVAYYTTNSELLTLVRQDKRQVLMLSSYRDAYYNVC